LEIAMPATALTVIHKHIRREMFDFSMRLFRAGAHDIGAIQAAFEELAALLRTHAAQEEIRLEPLLNVADTAAAAELLRDHRRLEIELDRLAALTRALDPSACTEALLQLHLDWNRYLSACLAHLDEEERTLFASVADSMPLDAIAQSALAQGAEGQKFLARLWSVTTPSERIAIEGACSSAAEQRAQHLLQGCES
jgi:hypothetical protein